MRPEDRPKAIVLLVAVVAVFAFVIFRFLGGRSAEPTPAASAGTGAAPAPSASVGGTVGTTPGTSPTEAPRAALADEQLSEIDSATGLPPLGGVNPFRRTVSTVAMSSGPGGSAAAAGATAGGAGFTPVPIDPIASTMLEVQGVIVGSPAYAIIKAGGETLYLRDGDALSDTVRLVAVKSNGVVLRHKGKRHTILIGEPKQIMDPALSIGPTGDIPVGPLPAPTPGQAGGRASTLPEPVTYGGIRPKG
jgi:hypothetical protein